MIGNSTSPSLFPWQHAAVRDLAWVLASPPLLQPPANGVSWLDAGWCKHAYAASEEWLVALDHCPVPLLATLEQRKDQRLGSYFEGLLAFWLAWPENPLYRLVGQNLAVRDGKRTQGELDFLVQDRQSGELQHWEVAVKFYLGTASGGAHANWQGPGLKDRLDLKVDHLLQHQLTLGTQPETLRLLRQLGLPAYPPTPACLLKGRLFYPPDVDQADWAPQHATPDHLTGWWMPWDDFLVHYGDSELRWIPLPREHWLTPVAADAGAVPIRDAQTAAAFIETLRQSADNRAAAVIGLSGTEPCREVTRGFVTPSDWP